MGAPGRIRFEARPAPLRSLPESALDAARRQRNEALRQAELEVLAGWVPAGAEVLELGGAGGFQAALLASLGCRVISLDLCDPSPPPAVSYHEVQGYDGTHIPFPNASFDVGFSSTVLQSVPDRVALLAELRRVIRPGGLSLHTVPTANWRAWTCLSHYPAVARSLGWQVAKRLRRPAPAAGDGDGGGEPVAAHRPDLAGLVRWARWPQRVGAYRNVVDEYMQTRASAWADIFEVAGYEVEAMLPSGLFYTGNLLLPWSIARRQAAARVLGSGSLLVVARAEKGAGPCGSST